MRFGRRKNISGKMRHILSLPRDVMLEILTFLPDIDLISVEKTCQQWCDLSQDNYIQRRVRRLATRIESSWRDRNYWPDAPEVRCAASLVTTGYLSEDVMTNLATRIQSSWSDYYWPSVAEVQCAAALAATGHLTSVRYMRLRDLELPSIKDILSLARVVSNRVELARVTGDLGPLVSSLACPQLYISHMELDQAATSSGVSIEVRLSNVTGDLGPLLSSLTCAGLSIENMELDQAATSSLVRGLQHGVETLYLDGRVRLHIQTLVEWDGRGRCGEVTCCCDTWDTYKEEMRTCALQCAARVNWGVEEGSGSIVIRSQYVSRIRQYV